MNMSHNITPYFCVWEESSISYVFALQLDCHCVLFINMQMEVKSFSWWVEEQLKSERTEAQTNSTLKEAMVTTYHRCIVPLIHTDRCLLDLLVCLVTEDFYVRQQSLHRSVVIFVKFKSVGLALVDRFSAGEAPVLPA